jgi:hypothetical protein
VVVVAANDPSLKKAGKYSFIIGSFLDDKRQ